MCARNVSNMSKIHVSKIEAARRQVDTAIRLLFSGGDPIAIHTLASAGGRILRDLCAAKNTPHYESITDLIQPGKEAAFWSAMNRPANFLKHADTDGEDSLDLEEQSNDLLLFLCVTFYQDLGQKISTEMSALMTFVTATHPQFIKPTATMFKEFADKMEWLRTSPRAEQLSFVNEVLHLLAQKAA
jgi:hypothetical protein